MYSYVAYNLDLYSALLLPELNSGNSNADVVIRFGNIACAQLNMSLNTDIHWKSDQEIYLYWRHVGKFLIKGGQEIIIEAAPEAEESRIRLFLLGAAMGVLLTQRGYFVLHASAVAIDGGAVLFLGEKGWGKSTLAAALYTKGHKVLSDDVVAVDLHHPIGPAVLSAFPQIKIWPAAADFLGIDRSLLSRLSAQFEKQSLSIHEQFSPDSFPLSCIYLLGNGPELCMEPLPRHEATVQLLRNVYMLRFGEALFRSKQSTYFRQCASLLLNTPAYYLKRPKSFELIEATTQLLEENS